MRHLLFATATVFTLAACGPILPQGAPAPRLFTFQAPRQVQAGAQSPYTLQIAAPQAHPGLDSARIAIRKSGQEMDYVADASWSGALPLLVQSGLVEAFENARAMRAVGSDLVLFKPDYVLAAEIRDFQVEYHDAGAPRVRVRLVTRVIQSESQLISATYSYEEMQPASANTLSDIAAAFDAAFARVSFRVVADTANALAAVPPQALSQTLPAAP